MPLRTTLRLLLWGWWVIASTAVEAHATPAPRLPPSGLAAATDSVEHYWQAGRQARVYGDFPGVERAEAGARALAGDIAGLLAEVSPEQDDPRLLELAAFTLRHGATHSWPSRWAARRDPLTPWPVDLELALGLALEAEEHSRPAAEALARVARAEHPLAPEAALRAARLYFRLAEEDSSVADTETAASLVDLIPKTADAAAAARLLLVERSCDGDDPKACKQATGRWLRTHRRATGAARVRWLEIEAHQATGAQEAAAKACLELMARHPGEPEALTAWSRYRELRGDESPGGRALYLAGVALAKQGERRRAAQALEAALADPEAADQHIAARLLLGKTLRKLGRYAESRAALEPIRQAAATERQKHEAGRSIAMAHWSARQIDAADQTFAQLAAQSPQHPRNALVLWLWGRMLEDHKRLEAAATIFDRLATEFPRDRRAAEAAWRSGLCMYRLNQPATAVERFSRPARDESTEAAERRLFWLGRAYERAGRRPEALAAYRGAAERWPRTYYGWRAATRVEILAGEPPPLPIALEPPDSLAQRATSRVIDLAELDAETRQAYVRGVRALQLGLAETGRQNLRRVEKQVEDDPWLMMHLADLYISHGIYDRAVSCGWDARHRSLGEPVEVIALRHLYPPAYASQVGHEARIHSIDPLLALALMRRESRFAPEATSGAGARGLMQLMPSTARGVARQLRLASTSAVDLYDPDLNVKLGTWYLASVLRDFRGRPDQALASYNAGRRKVEEWRRDTGDQDPELFVELIGYSETRNYVKKVLNDYFYYQVVYNRLNSREFKEPRRLQMENENGILSGGIRNPSE